MGRRVKPSGHEIPMYQRVLVWNMLRTKLDGLEKGITDREFAGEFLKRNTLSSLLRETEGLTGQQRKDALILKDIVLTRAAIEHIAGGLSDRELSEKTEILMKGTEAGLSQEEIEKELNPTIKRKVRARAGKV